jgi:hypothetical protein
MGTKWGFENYEILMFWWVWIVGFKEKETHFRLTIDQWQKIWIPC